MHISIAFILLACGLLLSATLGHGNSEGPIALTEFAPLQDATFSIASGRGRLLLAGVTTSAEHEAALLQLANDQFSHAIIRSDFHPGIITPANWVATSTGLLYALAAAESAQANIEDDAIEVRAVTFDEETLAARLRLLQQDSGTDTKINSDIIVVGNATPFEQLCAQAFSKLVLRPVSFRQSSAEIRTSSFVTLDRITEFAGDCRHAVIMIAGHTDSTSNESWNQQLSLARAQAVANHIARNGIDPQRLLVQGMGSSLPLADNSTVQGRGLNRRIEFDLL